ncbi:MAG TPA: hypothetical protein ENI80_00130 [Acidiferrobacteraceae bacterium]|nr:hypothetical protein [Acidiferrobacteraceae bacterium]
MQDLNIRAIDSKQDLTTEEIRRQKALRLLHDLRVTFGMDDLARQFLRDYVSKFQTTVNPADDMLIDRVMYRGLNG